MKLQQALVVYGLKTNGDVRAWAEADKLTNEQVTLLLDAFNDQYMGERQMVGEIVHGPTSGQAGLNIIGYTQLQQFAWSMTNEVRIARGWNCGLVEAAYRRFVKHVYDRQYFTTARMQKAAYWLREWDMLR